MKKRKVRGDEERFIYFRSIILYEIAVNVGDGSKEFPITRELHWFDEGGREFVPKNG